MSPRFDDLDLLLETLVRFRRRAGPKAHRRAVQAARVAVAKVILSEAERAAGRRRRGFAGNVLRFTRYPCAPVEREDKP